MYCIGALLCCVVLCCVVLLCCLCCVTRTCVVLCCIELYSILLHCVYIEICRFVFELAVEVAVILERIMVRT